jgi:ATP-binding cassette subfamily F protein 3
MDNRARQLQRELEQTESRIAALGEDKAALEARLSQTLPAAEIAELSQRFAQLNDELHKLEERWLELSTGLEAS